MTESDTQHQTEEEERWIGDLRTAFHTQYGVQADAATVVQILLHQINAVHIEDYWNCIILAYPQVFPSAKRFNDSVKHFDRIFNNSDFDILKDHRFPARWDWDLFLLCQGPNDEVLKIWDLKKDGIKGKMVEIDESWAQLKHQLQQLPESIHGEFQDGLVSQIERTVDHVRKEIHSTENIVEALRREVEDAKKPEDLSPSGQLEPHVPRKTKSWSSGKDIEQSMKPKNRKFGGTVGRKLRSRFFSSEEKQDLPYHTPKKRIESYPMGGERTVRFTVALCEIIGLVTTALATWKCSPPDEIPTIDSNFWSTISSAVIGLASLYCNIIPLLRKQEIKVDNKPLFNSLLGVSALMALSGAICYPYQTRASLVLLSLSGCAALAATWLLIEGAVQNITQNLDRIEVLEQTVNRLGDRNR